MSDVKSKEASLPWPAIFALVMLVGGAVFLRQSLTSSRPTEGGTKPLRGLGVQDVDACLWQDPLKAGEEHFESITKGRRRDSPAALARAASGTTMRLARSRKRRAGPSIGY